MAVANACKYLPVYMLTDHFNFYCRLKLQVKLIQHHAGVKFLRQLKRGTNSYLKKNISIDGIKGWLTLIVK